MNPSLFNAIYEQPWMIQGGYWRSIHAAVSSPQSLDLSDFFKGRQAMQIDANGVAHIEVSGVLGNHAPIAGVLGDSDYGVLEEELTVANQEASAALFHINSPGGQAMGCVELGSLAGSLKIPTAAHISGLGCSAAYAFAVGSDFIASEPSALCGSVGVIVPYLDQSGAFEKAGIKADYVTSGDLKAAGFPPSMNEQERAHMQEVVDDLFAQFSGHVTKFRSVAADSMRGQAYVAPRAKEHNLIDEVGSEETAYAYLIDRIR